MFQTPLPLSAHSLALFWQCLPPILTCSPRRHTAMLTYFLINFWWITIIMMPSPFQLTVCVHNVGAFLDPWSTGTGSPSVCLSVFCFRFNHVLLNSQTLHYRFRLKRRRPPWLAYCCLALSCSHYKPAHTHTTCKHMLPHKLMDVLCQNASSFTLFLRLTESFSLIHYKLLLFCAASSLIELDAT